MDTFGRKGYLAYRIKALQHIANIFSILAFQDNTRQVEEGAFKLRTDVLRLPKDSHLCLRKKTNH